MSKIRSNTEKSELSEGESADLEETETKSLKDYMSVSKHSDHSRGSKQRSTRKPSA